MCIRPGHVEQHVRHQRALPAGVELLEKPRKLTDDTLLAVALLAAPAVAASAFHVAVLHVATGEKPIPENKLDFFNMCSTNLNFLQGRASARGPWLASTILQGAVRSNSSEPPAWELRKLIEVSPTQVCISLQADA